VRSFFFLTNSAQPHTTSPRRFLTASPPCVQAEPCGWASITIRLPTTSCKRIC
jgi:hypothetical protein